MKHFSFLLTTFVFLLQTVNAQSIFAPVGAEWYNTTGPDGLFHVYVEKDTTVNGFSCRKVIHKAITNPVYHSLGLTIDDNPTIYIRNNTSLDTIFVYNTFFKTFTPLYIFNVKAGDTLTLPAIPNVGSLSSPTDSTFSIRIDSLKTETYNGQNLQTIYTTTLSINGKSEYYYGNYARSIGRIDGGLLPSCHTCAFPASQSVRTPGSLRCYSDTTGLNIRLVTDSCDRGWPPSSVSNTRYENELRIYPNPTHNRLTVDIGNIVNNDNISFTVTDVTGKPQSINTVRISNGSFFVNTSTLSTGDYILTVITAETIHSAAFTIHK